MYEVDVIEIEDAHCIFEAEKAIHVKTRDEEFWVPKSLICGGDVKGMGDSGTLNIPLWFADKYNLRRLASYDPIAGTEDDDESMRWDQ